nr:MAG: RNA-dependent RNA polymerase [Pseudoscorpian nodavirus]
MNPTMKIVKTEVSEMATNIGLQFLSEAVVEITQRVDAMVAGYVVVKFGGYAINTWVQWMGPERMYSRIAPYVTELKKDVTFIRREFQANYRPAAMVMPAEHSHGQAAVSRTTAAQGAEDWINRVGYTPYIVSMSSRDAGKHGSHGWYMPKDLQVAAKKDRIRERDILVMTDVDYYLDMGHYLSLDRHMMIYTFAPKELTGRHGNNTWAINTDGSFTTNVDGGSRYTHHLWNYEGDTLVHYDNGYHVYLVESKEDPTDPTRKMVFLCHLMTIKGFMGWVMWRYIQPEYLDSNGHTNGNGLRRQTFCEHLRSGHAGLTDYFLGKISVIPSLTWYKTTVTPGLFTNRYVQDGSEMISVSAGTGNSAEMRYNTWLLMVMLRNSPDYKGKISGIQASTVERCIKSGEGAVSDNIVERSHLVTMWLNNYASTWRAERRSNGGGVGEPEAYTVEIPQNSEHAMLANHIIVNTTSARNLTQPLVANPVVFPTLGINNQIAAMDGRVLGPLKADIRPRKFTQNCAREFIRMLTPQAGMGVPETLEYVEAHQTKSRQRARTEQVRACMPGLETAVGKMFVKNEPYSDIKDPRPITSTNTKYQLQLQQYLMAYKRDVLEGLPWFTPGTSNVAIADRVVELVSPWLAVVETDYSRFDGTIGLWMRRNVEEPALRKYFATQYLDDLSELLRSEHGLRVHTRDGLSYFTTGQRCSGTPLTTVGNTIFTGFVQFVALRMLGHAPQQAYQMLGACNGDDGLMPCYDTRLPALLEDVSSQLGFKLKCAVRTRGETVTYLARFYPEAWYGNPGSIQDPMRQHSKMHVSTSPGSLAEIACNKAHGLLALDPAAPITSTYAKGLLTMYGDRAETDNNADRPWAVSDRTTQTWPQLTREAGLSVIAQQYGVTAGDVDSWDEQIEMSGNQWFGLTLNDCQGLLPNTEVKVELPVVVGARCDRPFVPIATQPLQKPVKTTDSRSDSGLSSTSSATSRDRRQQQRMAHHLNRTVAPKRAPFARKS